MADKTWPIFILSKGDIDESLEDLSGDLGYKITLTDDQYDEVAEFYCKSFWAQIVSWDELLKDCIEQVVTGVEPAVDVNALPLTQED